MHIHVCVCAHTEPSKAVHKRHREPIKNHSYSIKRKISIRTKEKLNTEFYDTL